LSPSFDTFGGGTSDGPCAASAGADKESNWLPARRDVLVLLSRHYWADQAVLDGSWLSPKVEKTK
jgi:hypothetical protein